MAGEFIQIVYAFKKREEAKMRVSSVLCGLAAAAMVVAVSGFNSSRAADRDPRDAALPDQVPEAVKKAIAFDKIGKKLDRPYRIGYLPECATNTYCEARLRGLQDAANKYGFTFKTFDAQFNPQTQLKHVQNAVQENFDAYIFSPTADAAGCKMWREYLVPTGKPVVTVDVPMCGDVTYTPGLAGTVTMQSQPYFDFHVENAFASACKGREVCKGVSLSGFAGSDLFAKWEKAIDNGLKKYPNVKMVARQEAKFDTRLGQQNTQDALQVHRDLRFVVSHWDDMTLGAVAAIKSAGLVPGKDVLIYSDGANKLGIKQIRDGAFNETTILDPYDESYYAAVAVVMALSGQPLNAYINEADLPRITEGPGTLLITKTNVDKFTPNY
jgi:galactofuranose transport system substrate-binding protein